ncbi:MAG: hypothetical protein ABF314_12980, partial [Nocardioides sp.]
MVFSPLSRSVSSTRSRPVRRAAALVPLAVLSTAWTVSVVATGAANPTAAGGAGVGDETDPEASVVVPRRSIEAPASVSAPEGVSPGFEGFVGTEAEIRQIVSTSSTNGIPAAALSAYQRAEAVINSADKACNLSWQLIAAIGRVESDHGRYAGNA